MALFWCILAATSIGVCFKLFAIWKVNAFNAIVVNYSVCLVLGSWLDADSHIPFSLSVIQSPWFKFDILLGILFITGFNLTAYAVQKAGITLTVMMQKMSVLLTVSFTVIIFHEHFGIPEFIGLLMAILAILAINQKGTSFAFKYQGSFIFILFLVLFFSASIEVILFWVEKTGLVGDQQMAFTTHGFGTAAVIGWLIMIWNALKGKFRITFKDLYAGIMLGLPNYFSIYLLLVLLNRGWQGSIMYPLVNVSVLVLSTMIAVIAFREKLTRINWIGILLATVSILIISHSHNPSGWKIIF